ncbi:hypothetical protein ACF0H5_016105 [Mactra antiquata]
MSTPRTYNSCSNQERREMETCVGCKNRIVPGLLRLDSTGEVSSAKAGQIYQSPLIKSGRSHQPDSGSPVKKQSMMNSLGAYIGSAKAYFEKFYPQQTMSKGFVRNYSNRQGDLFQDYLVNSSSSADTMNSVKQQDCFNFESCPCPLTVDSRTEGPVHWTENLLCALHSSLLHSCSSTPNIMSKHPAAQKYIPPQRRCQGSYAMKPPHVAVDPKLTPYNARLLQKSKKCQSDSQSCKKEAFMPKSEVKNMSVHTDRISGSCRTVNSDAPTTTSDIVTETPDLSDKGTGKDNFKVIKNEIVTCNNSQTAEETQSETKTTDWFEYESKPVENSPRSEPVCSVSQRYIPPTQGMGDCAKQLHNWFSVENGNDVNKSVETNFDESSQTSEIPSNVCDTGKQDCNSEKCRLFENHDFNVEVDLSAEDNVKIHVSPMQQKDKDTNGKCESDGSTKQALIAALYIRNCGKKNRPSAKKRRRHKAQQKGEPTKVTISADNKNIDSKNKINNSTDQCPTSVVAFILGHDDSDDDDDDIDSDSDWSDNDFDENLSSLDDEDLNACDIGFRCTDPLMFNMSCSIQPSTPAEKEDDDNSIDKINMMWKVQVSVDTPKRKSTSSKKVHFADSESIATVHPMVTWCYAYQAARKGPWEQYARDRARFNRRITETEVVLKPILLQKHRDLIFTERFADESRQHC